VYKWTKLQGDAKFTSKVMGYQIYAIEKAIRPLFADQTTNFEFYNTVTYNRMANGLHLSIMQKVNNSEPYARFHEVNKI